MGGNFPIGTKVTGRERVTITTIDCNAVGLVARDGGGRRPGAGWRLDRDFARSLIPPVKTNRCSIVFHESPLLD